VDLPQIIQLVIGSVAPAAGSLDASGPAIRMPAYAAAPLSLALHELASNALEHGAWSRPGGVVTVRWHSPEPTSRVCIEWLERGGPVIESEPPAGVGSTLLRGFVEYELRGAITVDFRREGLVCVLDVPLDLREVCVSKGIDRDGTATWVPAATAPSVDP
jgi:two-component sensor histidine kinase